MKRRMEQLLNGRFIYQAPRLILSDTSLELTVNADSSEQGEFFFAANDNSRIKGMMSSSHRRIVLEKDKFSGNAIHIRYVIDTRGLKSGEDFEGIITVSSSLEEVSIPVSVCVGEEKVQAGGNEIRSLDSFVRLARVDMREAFRLYTSPSFEKLLRGKDGQYRPLYLGLSGQPTTYQHMEEFLVAARKKEAVSLRIDREEKIFDDVKRSQKDTLYIYKNTWGYIRMEIEIQGDFIQVEKKVVTSEDFIGSAYGLEYVVRRERLRKGKNFGRIFIHTVYGTLTYTLTVTSQGTRDPEAAKRKGEEVLLNRQLLAYCMESIDAARWKENTLGCLREIENQGRMQPEQYLYLTMLHHENQEMAEAVAACWPLKETVFGDDEGELEGLALYMKKKVGLLGVQEDIRERLYGLYERNRDSFPLLWAWLEENPEFTDTRRMLELEKMEQMDCISPFFYMAVWKIIHRDINQLKKLSPMILHTLLFAAHAGRLTEEMAVKTACLAQHEKRFQPVVYRVLCACYDVKPDREVLTAIVRLVMMEHPEKKEYFRWYALAVEEQIRMTGLYEYYIETMQMPFTDVFPQVIRLYFVYNNRLSDSQKAFVYANVIRNREIDKVTYMSYREAMGRFALEQLDRGKINEDYAQIYQELIGRITDKRMAEAISRVMFTQKIVCRDKKIRRVIVVSPYLCQEAVYPMRDGQAYVQLYTEDEEILFEDGMKRRYGITVECERHRLMECDKYAAACQAADADVFGLLVHSMAPRLEKMPVTEDNLAGFLRIAEDERFTEDSRFTARTRVLEYYTKHDKEEMPEKVLRLILEDAFAKSNKPLVIRALMQRRMYADAFDIITKYGYEHIDIRHLYTLCTRLIEETHYAENDELICLAFELFGKNKVNTAIMTYLRDNYVGPLSVMNDIRNRLSDKNVDSKPMDEELLILSMYVRRPLRDPGKILYSYQKGETSRMVVEAFLVYSAFNWFMADDAMADRISLQLERLVEEKEDCNPICRLAILKDYTFRPELDDRQREMVRRQLDWLHRHGIRFSFYQELPPELIQAYQLEDRLFIEEKASPGDKITIYYRLVRRGAGNEEFRCEPMKDMFQGIFVKEFLLFYGETVEYYLVKEHGKERSRSEMRQAVREQAEVNGRTKYQMLNRILASRQLKRQAETDKLMLDYLKQDTLSEQIFTIL